MKYDSCQRGLNDFVESYLQNETRVCGYRPVPFASDKNWWKLQSAAWYANFMVFWLGAFQSPEFLHFGYTMKNFDEGVWDAGWGDQQFWTNALGLVTNESRVLDRTDLRIKQYFTHKSYPGAQYNHMPIY